MASSVAAALGRRAGKVRVALCQLAVTADKASNLTAARRAVEDAAGRGAELVVLPEVGFGARSGGRVGLGAGRGLGWGRCSTPSPGAPRAPWYLTREEVAARRDLAGARAAAQELARGGGGGGRGARGRT